MKITIVAIDKHKQNAAQELVAEYVKRITWPLQLIELVSKNKHQAKEAEGILIEKYLDQSQFIICLDEHGDNLSSHEMAKTIEKITMSGQNLTFIIGGADGIAEKILSKANKKIAFGRQTWPHKFVKFMLLEQVYRAQQIISGHPYHKE